MGSINCERRKRVAIIGGGYSGIVSLKYALQHGLDAVVFEKYPTLMGNFNINQSTAMWSRMLSTGSIYSQMFSDYMWEPVNGKIPFIPTKEQIYSYLMKYAKRFNLLHHIRSGIEVIKVKEQKSDAKQRWQLELKSTSTNEITSETFDCVMIASGLFRTPNIPECKNMDKFKGTVMHSIEFELDDARLKDKKVLVVGNCTNGVEICDSLVGHAREIVNIFRRPYIAAKKLEAIKLRNNENKYKILTIDLNVNTRYESYLTQCYDNDEAYKRKYELVVHRGPQQIHKNYGNPDLFYHDRVDSFVRIGFSSNYLCYVNQGKIKAKKANIIDVDENGVHLDDGSYETADVILFCTGLNLNVDYLDDEVVRKMEIDRNNYRYQFLLYKSTIHPAYDNLAMISQNDGLFFIGAELQARWASLLFSGKMAFPDKEKMWKEIDLQRDRRNMNLNEKQQQGANVIQVDNIAREMNLLPDFEKMKKEDPELFKLFWNNPCLTVLFKYDEDPENALKLIREVDRIFNKIYTFDEEPFSVDANGNPTPTYSITKIAQKFVEENPQFSLPFHFFKT